MRYPSSKNILVILGIVVLSVGPLFAEEAAHSCTEEIRNINLHKTILPKKMLIDQFVISSDSTELICLATVWIKSLDSYFSGEYYLINEFPAPRQEKKLDAKESALIIAEWRQMKKEEGIKFEERYRKKWPSSFRIKKQEFFVFNIKDSRWREIDWDVGNGLFNQYSDRIVNPERNSISKEEVPSPDGSKVLSKEVWKRGTDLFGDIYHAYLIKISCLHGTQKQVLKIGYGYFVRWYVQWSPNGTFVLFIDNQDPQQRDNKIYILR